MINVIGLGYIGLPTALILSKNGLKVVGTDISSEVVQKLNSGIITFEENGLQELFIDACKNKIVFSTEYIKTDIYIIAVPTPFLQLSKKLDSSYIIKAVHSVLDICEPGSIIVIESTISPGSIDRYVRPEVEKRNYIIGKDIHIVHAPERIIPGNMIYELENNSRTIGADSIEIANKIKTVYSSFCKGEIVVTDIRSAEMSKVVENTYRDINIAFANELAKICRSDNMDVYEIIKIANKHPRVNILQPGPGVGGHCISVDPWFLVGDYPDLTNLILSARKVNDSMPNHVLKRISFIMKENNIRNVSDVGLYGLTYKENVDDTRESPTLQLLKQMEEHLSFGVKVYDPYIKSHLVENQYFDFNLFINDIKILVIMVAHKQIIENINLLSEIIIFDTKNIVQKKGVYKL
ncbi:nucleotide sugar dehydrogenase [Peloplasma aerotolerans]|uniref:Nucleotide sugar dehydrogenase n=1 Tax=Peloplasma aerotolerans TaxID=3044389 RepID=A0AAW6UA58_9MOLU|nr:nucleotide sugar dehydrogenase [Mariniplasma sp. M4Ah]MDI6452386.1 nucleotide sugar dehydrogenase [Mariniplasma sp. M4Ah]